MRVVLHQLGQPVGADVGAARVTGHRDLERLDRARWLPPQCADCFLLAWRWLLGGVPNCAVRAEGGELARARAAVAAWRDRNPAGTGEELLATIGHQFHRDYGVVLRAVLFAVDRHRAHQVTGIPGMERRL
jgi:hypothetical protein